MITKLDFYYCCHNFFFKQIIYFRDIVCLIHRKLEKKEEILYRKAIKFKITK